MCVCVCGVCVSRCPQISTLWMCLAELYIYMCVCVRTLFNFIRKHTSTLNEMHPNFQMANTSGPIMRYRQYAAYKCHFTHNNSDLYLMKFLATGIILVSWRDDDSSLGSKLDAV